MNRNLFGVFGRWVNLRNCVRIGSLFLLASCMLSVQVSAGAGLYTVDPNNNAFYKKGTWVLTGSEYAEGTIRFEDLQLGDSNNGFNGMVAITGPVDGVLTLDGTSYSSTLILGADLILGSKATLAVIQGAGVGISGNGHSIIMRGDLTLPADIIYIPTDLVIDGQGHILTVLNSSIVFNTVNGHLTLKNMVINGLSADNYYNLFSVNSSLTLQDCTINIPPETTWNCNFQNEQQHLVIKGDVIIRGGGIFKTSFCGMYIQEFSTLTIDHDTTFEYGDSSTGLEMTHASSTLLFNGSTFKLGKDLSPAISGTLTFEDNCIIDGGYTLTLPATLTTKILADARVNVTGGAKITIS